MVTEVTKRVFVSESDGKEFNTHHEAGIHEDVITLKVFIAAVFPGIGAPKVLEIATTIAERYEITERVIDAPAVG